MAITVEKSAATRAGHETSPPAGDQEGKLQWLALLLLYAFTAVALAGYAAFAAHPERLAGQSEGTIRFFGQAFQLFSHGHAWLAMAVLLAALIPRSGFKWVLPFIVVYSVSLGSELAGTTWGVPFGAYEYSAILAPMWLDRVPLLIPASWFYMALPSFAIAACSARGTTARIAIGSLILLSWDLALDPAMSYATKYWIWADSGPYYGMPWLNLFGWYITGVVLMWVLASFRVERWTGSTSQRWWKSYYGAVLLMPLGMCAASGLWVAVVATLFVLAALHLALHVNNAAVPAVVAPEGR